MADEAYGGGAERRACPGCGAPGIYSEGRVCYECKDKAPRRRAPQARTDDGPRVPCSKCSGSGTVRLDEVFVATLYCMRVFIEVTAEALSRAMDVNHTAMNNRLEHLRRHGLVTRRREGKTWWYRVEVPAPAEPHGDTLGEREKL